jgi:hypothetical protein
VQCVEEASTLNVSGDEGIPRDKAPARHGIEDLASLVGSMEVLICGDEKIGDVGIFIEAMGEEEGVEGKRGGEAAAMETGEMREEGIGDSLPHISGRWPIARG